MPMIQITMLAGRTAEQKRKIAQRVADFMVEETRTSREGVAVAVAFHDKESYARGGVLISDK